MIEEAWTKEKNERGEVHHQNGRRRLEGLREDQEYRPLYFWRPTRRRKKRMNERVPFPLEMACCC